MKIVPKRNKKTWNWHSLALCKWLLYRTWSTFLGEKNPSNLVFYNRESIQWHFGNLSTGRSQMCSFLLQQMTCTTTGCLSLPQLYSTTGASWWQGKVHHPYCFFFFFSSYESCINDMGFISRHGLADGTQSLKLFRWFLSSCFLHEKTTGLIIANLMKPNLGSYFNDDLCK